MNEENKNVEAEEVVEPKEEMGEIAKALQETGTAFEYIGKNNSAIETVSIDAANLEQTAKTIKTKLKLTRLNFLTALEVKDAYQAVYMFDSVESGKQIIVKTNVNKENPSLVSLTSLFPTANWQEREAFDMIGLHFEGHPNLTRILNPDKWEGHPLRKDYIGPMDALNEPINYKQTAKA